MLDSGGAYGRHWEKPPLPSGELPNIRNWDPECSATIELAAYLEGNYEILTGVHEAFEKWLTDESATDERGSMSWFETVPAFLSQYVDPDHGKYADAGLRNNVYNEENDFSQVFVYEVWSPEEDGPNRDPIYNHNNEIVVIFIHTGCDVRGGYSAPLFCRSKMDYTAPVECCAEYAIAEARRYRRVKYLRSDAALLARAGLPDPAADFVEGPDVVDHDSERSLDEEWQANYHSWPYGHLRDDVKRWFEFTRTRDSVCVQLKTGEIAKVVAQVPYMGT